MTANFHNSLPSHQEITQKARAPISRPIAEGQVAEEREWFLGFLTVENSRGGSCEYQLFQTYCRTGTGRIQQKGWPWTKYTPGTKPSHCLLLSCDPCKQILTFEVRNKRKTLGAFWWRGYLEKSNYIVKSNWDNYNTLSLHAEIKFLSVSDRKTTLLKWLICEE